MWNVIVYLVNKVIQTYTYITLYIQEFSVFIDEILCELYCGVLAQKVKD